MNKVLITGRLVDRKEIKFLQSGCATIKVTVETEDYNSKTKEMEPNRIEVVLWGKPAEAAAAMPDGAFVVVEGKIQAKSYEYQGKTRNSQEVVAQQFSVPPPPRRGGADPLPEELTDDLPF